MNRLQVEVQVLDDDGFVLAEGSYPLDPNTGGVEIETEAISLTAASLKIHAKYDRVKYSQIVKRALGSQREFLSLDVLTPRYTKFVISFAILI